MKRLPLVFILILSVFTSMSQDLSLFEKHWLFQGGDTLPYRVLLPENFDSSKKYPLVIFLHGRGESGSDNETQLVHGAKLFLRDSIRRSFPAIVIFPQCARNSYWSNVQMITKGSKNGKRSFYFREGGEATASMKLLLGLVENLFVQYAIKKEQVYVMGLSMGGMGTFELVRRSPGVFAAAVPICGGANIRTAPLLSKTRWWVFHGDADDVVPVIHSTKMIAAMRAAGVNTKATIYPGVNHNSWDKAFDEPGLLRWLFAQRKN
jgi:predicted peptidase